MGAPMERLPEELRRRVLGALDYHAVAALAVASPAYRRLAGPGAAALLALQSLEARDRADAVAAINGWPRPGDGRGLRARSSPVVEGSGAAAFADGLTALLAHPRVSTRYAALQAMELAVIHNARAARDENAALEEAGLWTTSFAITTGVVRSRLMVASSARLVALGEQSTPAARDERWWVSEALRRLHELEARSSPRWLQEAVWPAPFSYSYEHLGLSWHSWRSVRAARDGAPFDLSELLEEASRSQARDAWDLVDASGAVHDGLTPILQRAAAAVVGAFLTQSAPDNGAPRRVTERERRARRAARAALERGLKQHDVAFYLTILEATEADDTDVRLAASPESRAKT